MALLASLDSGVLIAGFVASTIGFSVFLYGKKQARPPQLVGGLVLMAVPFFGGGVALLASISCAAVAGIAIAVRAGW